MVDREKVIQGLEFTKAMITFSPSTGEDIEPRNLNEADKTTYDACIGAIALLKAQEIEEPHPWEHIWDAPDYTFKGRCRNCGFIHYFIQGHDAQYRFCPQCGEQKVI